MADFDIIIIGAGPAGSCFARLAAGISGLRVALVDARALDTPYTGKGRMKSCGGLLAPDAQKALACMDMVLPAHLLVTPQLFAVRTLDLPSGLEHYYQRFYLNVNREDFDRWLFASVDSRVQKFLGSTVKSISPDATGHSLVCDDGTRLHGRFIVGADGANSVVRRKLFPHLHVQRYISIQERFPRALYKAHFAAFFDQRLTDYYGWGLPKGDEYLIGAAFPAAAGAEEKFTAFKERIQPFGYATQAPLCRETTLLLRPNAMPPCSVHENGTACLLGEAGGYISPSSAEGFSYAFRTAQVLYRSLRQTRKNSAASDYFSDVCRLHARLMQPLRWILWTKILKKQVLYRPSLRRLVMRSGLQALHRL